MNARTVALAAATAATTAGMLTAFRRGFGAGLAAGYKYGETDGFRRGLAYKPQAGHATHARYIDTMAGSVAYTEALLRGDVREPVGEDAS